MVEVEIRGLNELIFAFSNLSDDIRKKVTPAVNEAGDLVLQRAKEKVSKYHKYSQAGTLKNSLYLKKAVYRKGALKASCTITWGDDVRKYAAPLELGHAIRNVKGGPILGRAEPHPFLRPAADESKKETADIITKAIDRTLQEMGGIK